MRRLAIPLLLPLPLLLLALGVADAASPQLNRVIPRGAQRGKTLELRFYGRRLEEPEEVLLYDEGIRVLEVREIPRKDKNKKTIETRQVRVKVEIDPDCRPGEHRLRLRTKSGITELRTFWVGVLPEQAEKEPNGGKEIAQPIQLETTIAGRVQREDVDWYAFTAQAGQRVAAELVAMRLGDVVFDASLELLDAERFVVASSDDTSFAGQDPVLEAVLEKAGTYYLVVRESAYGGNDPFHYRLHVGSFPRPRVAFPPGGVVGQAGRVRFPGALLSPVASQALVFAPEGPQGYAELLPQDAFGIAPSPLRLGTGALPTAVEQEPNDRPTATPITLPCAVHGQVHERNHDWFAFKAKKGERYTFRVRARELGSPLDAVVNVFERNGKHLVGNDDLRGNPDALVRFRAPADGEYDVRVRDFLERGGEDFVYRLEVAPEVPELELDLQPIGRQTQIHQTLSVPAGGRAAVLLRTRRRGFREPLQVSIAGLGSGVVSEVPEVIAPADVVPLVISAHENARTGGGLVEVSARSLGKTQVAGSFLQTVPLAVGAPNQSVYHTTSVDRLAVAVSERVPFSIELAAPKAPLVRLGTKDLVVKVKRDASFKGQVVLQLLYDPPGVRSRRNVVVKPDEGEARIRLDANGKAVLGVWPIVVQARVRVANGGDLWTSSQVESLTLADVPLTLAMSRVATPQGVASELAGQVAVKTAFTGEARVELLRLPKHVSAPAQPLAADGKTISFPLTVGPQARVGRHPVFCQVTIPGPEPIVVYAGWTELRVDSPPKQPAKAKPKPKPQPKPAAKGKAPLRRLDRLREEYEQAKDGSTK